MRVDVQHLHDFIKDIHGLSVQALRGDDMQTLSIRSMQCSHIIYMVSENERRTINIVAAGCQRQVDPLLEIIEGPT
jgi:outer membrane receptor for ferrienterochelin and colicin